MKKIKLWYLLLTAFFYYPILLKFKVITYAIVYLIPLIFFLMHYQWVYDLIRRIKNTKIMYSVYAVIIIGIASIAVPILMGTNDFSYFSTVLDIIKFAYRSLFLLCVFELYVSKEKSVELFMRYFIYSCCLYIAGTVVFLLAPVLKEWWINIISIPAMDMEHIQKSFYVTRFGWSGFAGFSCTMWCCLAVIFNVYIIVAENDRKEHFWKEFISLAVLLCGNMFYGRIGFVLSIFCVCMMMLYFLTRKPWYIVTAIIVVAVLIGGLLILKERSVKVQEWYNWCFSIINNFIASGRLGTESTDILFGEMLFIPKFATLVLGDGKFSLPDGAYYMHTDSGLVRPVLFYGVFFTVISYFVLWNLILCLKNRRVLKKEHALNIMILNLLIVWFAFELKGPTFYLMATYLLPISVLMQDNKKECKQ